MMWIPRTNSMERQISPMIEQSQGSLNPAPTKHKQRQAIELRTEGKHKLLQGKLSTPLWLA